MSSAPAAGLRTNCLWRLGPRSPYGESMPKGIVTGASRGLGRVLAQELARRDWQLVVDARGAELLGRSWTGVAGVVTIAGDVTDADHRRALIEAVEGPIDGIVPNPHRLRPHPQAPPHP